MKKQYFLLISKPKFFFIVLLVIIAFSFSVFINNTNAAEMSGYRFDKSSEGKRVDKINIVTNTANFGADAGTITLDGIIATFSNWQAESIGGVVVPAQVEGVADVVVTLADGAHLNIGSFVVNPKITSVSPSPFYITEAGAELTVNGEGFRELADCSGVLIGDGNKIDVLSWSDTKLIAKLVKNKSLSVGQHQLIVKSCGDSSPFPLLVKQAMCDTAQDWACGDWSSCQADGYKTRICTQVNACDNPPETKKSCKMPPVITSFSPSNIYVGSAITILGKNFGNDCTKTDQYCGVQVNQTLVKVPSSDWSDTSIKFTLPSSADDGYYQYSGYFQIIDTKGQLSDRFFYNLAPACSEDTWSCGDWNSCSSYGTQSRTCAQTFDCPTAYTSSPTTSQNCTPPQPTCTADTWTCDSWGACSLSGIQSRNCTKTFDCPNIQSVPPLSDQYCEAPSRPQQTPPSESDEISNQGTIIKATVKLLCPVDAQKASQGSGTVIDSTGTILTNKHVVVGTLGCLVGFIDDFDNEPYFGDRQIADIIKVSSNQDIAVLKIRNPQNKKLPYVDTTKGSVNFALGTKITTYGYPAKFGTKVTYTSGDFSGTDGGYLKTTAILEYGNSGGGAYLKNGTYIGIPSAVVKGELNALGYILSINTIRAWLNNSGVASSNTNNNYSRVSILEDIDLKKLGSLKLFIPDVDEKSNLVTPTIKQESTQNAPKTAEQQPQITQPQKESVVIESSDLNEEGAIDKNVLPATEQQKPKISVTKRFFLWLSNLFNKLATR